MKGEPILLKPGGKYLIGGYYTGDFIGQLESLDKDVAILTVLDPLRPFPKVRERCCYPQCIRADFHAGEHEFPLIRAGGKVEIFWANARWMAPGAAA